MWPENTDWEGVKYMWLVIIIFIFKQYLNNPDIINVDDFSQTSCQLINFGNTLHNVSKKTLQNNSQKCLVKMSVPEKERKKSIICTVL